jgi:RNA polymerase sigma factor (sigma-70 family)
MSEPEIIEGCRQCDRKAQRALYDCYADELMTISIRYCRDISEAKDNLHDALIRIYKNISNYDSTRGSLFGWMSRIVVNEALQKYRRRKVVFYNTEQVDDSELSDSFNILDDLAANDILALLQKLPDGCRLVFNLSVVEEFKHDEISHMLGISKSASRAQLSKAKKLIRTLLDKQKKTELRKAI